MTAANPPATAAAAAAAGSPGQANGSVRQEQRPGELIRSRPAGQQSNWQRGEQDDRRLGQAEQQDAQAAVPAELGQCDFGAACLDRLRHDQEQQQPAQ